MLTFTSSRRVKIVCTLGPTSEKPEILASLIQEGMDVVRLNFSHGDHSFHKKLFQTLRETAQKAKKPVAIMQDLQGPKLRVGVLQSGVLELKAGDKILLYPEGKTIKQSTKDYIPVPVSPEIAEVIAKCIHQGARILFDDGKISAQAIKISAPEIIAEIETGGKLTNNKGMNLPGTPLPIPCLTEKDLEDLKLGLWLGVDAIALSFVRTDEDIITLRKKIQKITENPPLIIAKIEREEAVENHESILEVTDGLLIARGDMAVELGAARVPTIQKKLIHACNRKGVPVITATQMLESMIYSSTPTRAEASDVANAVFDGT
ncbi:MAG: pyruvate kinase, partial [Deltaproteobacteria bacterium]|nr:pyruvate kinase [Deltaproteobacteria bacterium]